jgi:hypothetical protein
MVGYKWKLQLLGMGGGGVLGYLGNRSTDFPEILHEASHQ